MEKEIICTEKHIVYLALGSNIGDKIKNLTSAIEEYPLFLKINLKVLNLIIFFLMLV